MKHPVASSSSRVHPRRPRCEAISGMSFLSSFSNGLQPTINQQLLFTKPGPPCLSRINLFGSTEPVVYNSIFTALLLNVKHVEGGLRINKFETGQ